ncbi:MAG: aspartate kinase, partial [Bacteroidota bacterium]
LGEVTLKTKDLILSRGELLSSQIIYQYFLSKGFKIAYADPREILKTKPQNGETEVDWESTEEVLHTIVHPLLSNNNFVVTGGYVGSDSQAMTTTLGRGGSDYSAAIFSSILHAERLEIWTDVDGILTADPRMIRNARLVEDVTYSEASELAYFGAKVLHPKTIFPSIEQHIPVYVMNTFHPENPGTRIMAKSEGGNNIKAITFRRGITIINIHSNRMLGAFGFLSRVFEVFNRHETSVDLVSTSEVSISVTIDNKQRLELILLDLQKISSVAIFPGKAILSAIGEGLRNDPAIAGRFFTAISGINVSLVTMGASEINLSIVVDEEDLQRTMELLHNEFFN